ncbi:probable protein phosphatase 2C 26 isoform X1 [Macadamia integrifolia]|uniref:probable protein phosphatase 2C 26 isoform X1 n=1 Tax=Macadamia integrifolia TaxID=60698 RepID=UPI001C4EFED5|nr:probable protein phosphatase 2C 26 isoform X1 [Macadamia integrifolia]
MSILISRSSIFHSRGLSFSFSHDSFNFDSILNKRGSLSCAPSELSPVRSEVSFCVGTHLIPHPSKIDKGGEDAFFVSSYNGGVLAIADGVSGWSEQNVDPALFSKELMANALNFVGDEEVNDDPQLLLGKAHAATSSKGSATVIVAMMEKNGILKIANVGDCGLWVLRKGKKIFSTSPQEHYFDCPYQLSSDVVGQTYLDAMWKGVVFDPFDSLRWEAREDLLQVFSSSFSLKYPRYYRSVKALQVCTLELIEGDTIVMGSDGLFDNVFDNEIISTILRFSDVVEAAKALAYLASNHSRDPSFDSPYSLEARNRGYDVPWWKKILGRKLTGGKLDDITVIVGQVTSS